MEHVMFMFVILRHRIAKISNVCICTTKIWQCAIGFALGSYVDKNERANPKSGMEMLQSNIYYCVRIKGVFIGGPKKNLIMII